MNTSLGRSPKVFRSSRNDLKSLASPQAKPYSKRPSKLVCHPAPPPGEEWEVEQDEAIASPLFAVTPHSSRKLEENEVFSPFAPAIPRSPNQMQTNIRSGKYLKAKEGSDSFMSLDQSRLTVSSSTVSPLLGVRAAPALRHLRPSLMRASQPVVRRTARSTVCVALHWDQNLSIGPLRLVLPFCSFESVLTLFRVSQKLKHSRELKRRMRDLLISGLLTSTRIKYWKYVTAPVRCKTSAHRYFSAAKTCPQDIQNDIFRTPSVISGQLLGKAHQEAMMRILSAVALFDRDVGYCQGMNYIAGLLVHLLDNEEDIFWLINTLLIRYKLKTLLQVGLRELKLRCFQLNCYMQSYLPEVAGRMKDLGISTEVYAAKWFVTLLSYELPLPLLLRVWDLFFQSDWKVIFRVILALLSVSKRELTRADSGTVTGLLNSLAAGVKNDESLLKFAFTFKVTRRLLEDLKQLKARKAKGRFQLIPGKTRKWEWIVTPFPSPLLLSPSTDHSEDSIASRLLGKVLDLFKGEEEKKGKAAELDSTICLDELQVPALDLSEQLPVKDLDTGEVHYIDLSQDHCFICGASSHSSRYCTADSNGALWVFPSQGH